MLSLKLTAELNFAVHNEADYHGLLQRKTRFFDSLSKSLIAY